MLNAADAAAAAAAILASRNSHRERERAEQEQLRKERGSKAAEWLRKQQVQILKSQLWCFCM